MTEDSSYISKLLQKHLNGSLSEHERIQLNNWLDLSPTNKQLFNFLTDPEQIKPELRKMFLYDKSAMVKKLQERSALLLGNDTDSNKVVHRIHFLRRGWFKYAAAIIVFLGVGTYLFLNNQKEKPSVTTTSNPVPVQNDVAPGGNRATLTLADGSKIILDTAKSGELAREANATITKTSDGRVVYNADVKLGNTIIFNTMTTPRGGQYQLTLPDGSQVWLNAESSITYPTAFTGNERKVSITGEAYFEVVKNKSKPFRVNIGDATVEVLGTHFNVNTYKEEPTNNITLLEGSVRIKSVHTSLILKPGQQGQLRGQQLSLAAHPDIEQVMAWKNGLFSFQDADLKDVMHQLSRWYDVEIVYEGEIPEREFNGKIGRQLTLSQVLKGLSKTKINYRIESGNRIVILP